MNLINLIILLLIEKNKKINKIREIKNKNIDKKLFLKRRIWDL